MRMISLLGILTLVLVSFSYSQEITFSYSGKWGKHLLYGVSVCSSSSRAMIVEGGRVWREAQLRGVAPLTHAQIQSYLDSREKWGFGRVAKTITLVSAGALTALQGSGVVGEKWERGYRAIAPGIGVVTLTLELAGDYQGKLEVPADFLPLSIELAPRACWLGSLIARGD